MPKVQYTIRVDEKYYDEVKIIAKKEIRSINNLFEYFIIKGVEEYKKNNKLDEIKITE